MANTARTKEEEKEYFDSESELDKKTTILAQWIKESKHFIAFTGAGISTACGIPDFRSGVDTVLDTGAGAWASQAARQKGIQVKQAKRRVGLLQAIPSKTHMALVELERKGYLKFLISQNVDGLHRRSGFVPQSLAELHGNTNLESCDKCGKQYLRDFSVRNARQVHSHETGRKCTAPNCGGGLCDTIINFGENLPMKEIHNSDQNSQKADLCLAMGSSLTVTPAADFPKDVGKKADGRLVIVNLQSTPLDHRSSLRIYAKCDDVMRSVMAKLKCPIPQWTLTRFIKISLSKPARFNIFNSDLQLTVTGVESDGMPASLFRSLKLCIGKGKPQFTEASHAHDLLHSHSFVVSPNLWTTDKAISERNAAENIDESKTNDIINDGRLKDTLFALEIEWSGHYNETTVVVNLWELFATNDARDCTLRLDYNPMNGEWNIPSQKELETDEIVQSIAKLQL